MKFYDPEDFVDTFDTNIPLHIRRNRGHSSVAPVTIVHSLTATGAFEVSPGFRPSSVRVYAVTDAVNDFSAAIGEFSWTPDGTRNDFSLCFGVDATGDSATGEEARFIIQDIVRIISSASTVLAQVEFVKWTELGFTCNTTVFAGNALTLRFVCVP